MREKFENEEKDIREAFDFSLLELRKRGERIESLICDFGDDFGDDFVHCRTPQRTSMRL